MWAVRGTHYLELTSKEATDSLRSARLATPTLKALSDNSVVTALVEDVAVAIAEVEENILQALAVLFSAPTLELSPLRSVNDTMRRVFASNVRRRVIASSSARSCWARNRYNRKVEMMVTYMLFE
jgi:flavorubredoxin